jgi:hypothetical protein
MSRYCLIKTAFKDGTALVAALIETGGWTKTQIVFHETPQHLHGHKGDQREEVANIIIKKQNVGKSSNDIGFVIGEDGCYEAIISEYDSKEYGQTWMDQLRGNYAYHKLQIDMSHRGRTVTRERCENGHQRVVVTGYR